MENFVTWYISVPAVCRKRDSSILNSARTWASVILAGQSDSGLHSTNSSHGVGNKLSNARNFIILLLEEGWTSSNKDNSVYFSGEKK